MVTIQADTFADERMKVLYALSFMCGGTAQVWAANETMAVITGHWTSFWKTSKRLLETWIRHGWLMHNFMSSK